MNVPVIHALLAAQLLIGTAWSANDLPKRTENKVFRDRVKPNWLPDGKSFWYRVQTGPGSHEFVSIDAATGKRKVAPTLKDLGLPEQEAVTTSKSKIQLRKTTRTGGESGFKFINQFDEDVDLFWINQQGEHVSYGRIRAGSEREQHTFEGHVWLITSRTGEHLAVIEAATAIQTLIIDGKGLSPAPAEPKKTDRGVKSPDGTWSVMYEKEFILLHHEKSDKLVRMKVEPAARMPFRDKAVWSPDSSTFVLNCAPPLPVRKVGFIESTPKDQLQPRLREFQ